MASDDEVDDSFAGDEDVADEGAGDQLDNNSLESDDAVAKGDEDDDYEPDDARKKKKGKKRKTRSEEKKGKKKKKKKKNDSGDVVDSRARSGADGAVQLQAKRQLEVFQSQVPGARLQVIKTHTVSSSRWTSSTSTTTKEERSGEKDFENLQLSLNPLDLTSQKSKASVGRSFGRRPPSRPRAREDAQNAPKTAQQQTAATNLHRVSRLCHQIHEDAVRQTFGRYYQKPPIHERGSGDGSVEIHEIEESETEKTNSHEELKRTKSTSSEDLPSLDKEKSTKSIEDLEDLEQLRNWRRTSKVRRSLQFAKQKSPENDSETGRRLSAALRGNNLDLEALDQILQSISSSSSTYSDESRKEPPEKEEISPSKQKRNSFVTVESLREVKGRLRHTSDIYQQQERDQEIDDGIVTEEPKPEMPAGSRVRSYVYGMEAMLNKKPVLGTGSLESKSKQLNWNSNTRGEDWHSRRKSYGFEQVTNEQEATIQSSISKTRVDSSTDSGICRSTEIVVPKKDSEGDSAGVSNVKKFASLFETRDSSNPFSSRKARDELTNVWNRRSSIEANGEWRQASNKSDVESTTITIPIVSDSSSKFPERATWLNGDAESEIKRHSIAVDESKYVTKNPENNFRRTSLAVNDSYPESNFFSDNADSKKHKKVEFCKTEVHFTAESGKVNIVETDEKPPPTNNFRRRRKNVGPIVDDFNRNGLPVLHFGDSSYEKVLLGLKDMEICDKPTNNSNNNSYETPVVTVNTYPSQLEIDDERKEANDSEIPRGILKNKPVKPKPYLLGDNEETHKEAETIDTTWGVKLKPVNREESTPIWRSTVTVRNTFFDKQNDHLEKEPTEKTEFQRLLRTLRPSQDGGVENNHQIRPKTENFGGIRIISPSVDPRRSSWSVADKVKHAEDLHWTENKGYSTKVNFGEGEATVVENNRRVDDNVRQATWPKGEDENKDQKRILNKGLVVRIGRDDTASKHTVCSKTTTNRNSISTTTTTKITIDLSPSPTNIKTRKDFNFSTSPLNSFKSTSLILNTIKSETENHKKKLDGIPRELEALRRLYDDAASDNEADREVQSLMSRFGDREFKEEADETASVVSGSWSRVTAVKNVSSVANRVKRANYQGRNALSSSHAFIEKDFYQSSLTDNYSPENQDSTVTKPVSNHDKPNHLPDAATRKTAITRNKYSPIVVRKSTTPMKRSDLTTNHANELSSPSLVGQNSVKSDEFNAREIIKSFEADFLGVEKNPAEKGTSDNRSQSPRLRHRSPNSKDSVLRQPRKSELAYFGIKSSPKAVKKETVIVPKKEHHQPSKLTEKPDLLQHHQTRSSRSVKREEIRTAETVKTSKDRPESPLYINIQEMSKKTPTKREFDASILEELTKAADQILQAVNGYTDDDSHTKNSSDDQAKRNNRRLDTISETKSWKQKVVQTKTSAARTAHSKSKLKHTSSTSSVESVSRECKRPTSITTRRNSNPTEAVERPKKLSPPSTKASTKARRLQRASSREALLQSHGSSSEDLPANVVAPPRKPRLIKKTKTAQLTVSNGLEMAKRISTTGSSRRREDSTGKPEERIPVIGLPEIRHKTAVSTIRSTAEKSAIKERARSRTEDARRKTTHKRETSRGSSSVAKNERSRGPLVKESQSHRISTANIKKCSKTDGSIRH